MELGLEGQLEEIIAAHGITADVVDEIMGVPNDAGYDPCDLLDDDKQTLCRNVGSTDG